MQCECCGRETEIWYESPFFSVEEVECLCPECIANGSASEKFDGQFQDDCSVDEVSDEDKLDELIHSHNTQAGTIFNIYTIWDDISIYYAKNLFPDINKIENLFKKVIYRFMIKVAGSTWTTTVLPKDIRKNLNEMAKSNGLTGLPDEDQLEFAYFDTLEEILFSPYSSRQYDQAKMVSILKDYVDTDILNKKVRELIEDCEAIAVFKNNDKVCTS